MKRPVEMFLRQCKMNFHHTGALVPSSKALARAMTSFVGQGDAPRRILEAGPGTGIITEEIARRMTPFDQLDVYEINPVFAEYLENRFSTEPVFRALGGRLTLHCADVLSIPREAVYDRIISSVPMNNFEPEWVRDLLASFMMRLTPAGILSYFEYVLIRTIKSVVSARGERERLKAVGEVTSEFVSLYQLRCDHVFFNLPPAVARHLVKPLASKPVLRKAPPSLQPAAAIR